MPKLTISELRKIILEETRALREGDAEDQAAEMVSSASKLLKAIEAFNDSISDKEKVKADVDPHVEELKKHLKRMIQSPMVYASSPKRVIKKVSMKPVEKLV